MRELSSGWRDFLLVAEAVGIWGILALLYKIQKQLFMIGWDIERLRKRYQDYHPRKDSDVAL